MKFFTTFGLLLAFVNASLAVENEPNHPKNKKSRSFFSSIWPNADVSKIEVLNALKAKFKEELKNCSFTEEENKEFELNLQKLAQETKHAARSAWFSFSKLDEKQLQEKAKNTDSRLFALLLNQVRFNKAWTEKEVTKNIFEAFVIDSNTSEKAQEENIRSLHVIILNEALKEIRAHTAELSPEQAEVKVKRLVRTISIGSVWQQSQIFVENNVAEYQQLPPQIQNTLLKRIQEKVISEITDQLDQGKGFPLFSLPARQALIEKHLSKEPLALLPVERIKSILENVLKRSPLSPTQRFFQKQIGYAEGKRNELFSKLCLKFETVQPTDYSIEQIAESLVHDELESQIHSTIESHINELLDSAHYTSFSQAVLNEAKSEAKKTCLNIYRNESLHILDRLAAIEALDLVSTLNTVVGTPKEDIEHEAERLLSRIIPQETRQLTTLKKNITSSIFNSLQRKKTGNRFISKELLREEIARKFSTSVEEITSFILDDTVQKVCSQECNLDGQRNRPQINLYKVAEIKRRFIEDMQSRAFTAVMNNKQDPLIPLLHSAEQALRHRFSLELDFYQIAGEFKIARWYKKISGTSHYPTRSDAAFKALVNIQTKCLELEGARVSNQMQLEKENELIERKRSFIAHQVATEVHSNIRAQPYEYNLAWSSEKKEDLINHQILKIFEELNRSNNNFEDQFGISHIKEMVISRLRAQALSERNQAQQEALSIQAAPFPVTAPSAPAFNQHEMPDTNQVASLPEATQLEFTSIYPLGSDGREAPPAKEFDSMSECRICYTEFDNNTRRVVLTCGHDLCANCLKQWAESKNNSTCPACKQDIDMRQFPASRLG